MWYRFPTYVVATRIIPGLGVSTTLPEHVRELGGSRVAIIGDRGLAKIGVLAPFEDLIRGADGLTLVGTGLADVDPTLTSVEQLAAEFADENVDVVVTIGGGSAMSVAKGVALRLRNPEPLSAYGAGVGLAPNAPIPTIAIPTTAGSGAEVSATFVLYSEDEDVAVRSVGYRGRGYEPDIALLDGNLLVGLPDTPMRDAALDAYSHAFEALWGRDATTFSDTAAFEALRLIRTHLPRSLSDRNPDDLQKLLEASSLANIACGNAGLGLVHAMTSAGSIHIAHGRQNGVLLPHVAEFNRAVVSERAWGEIDLLDELYDAIDAPRRFRADELPENAAEAIVRAALASPVRLNNARETTEDDLRRIAVAATAV
jgi:alcohol dehydrogenase class IV